MTKHTNTSRRNASFLNQDDSPEAVTEWVRRRLETQPINQIRDWARAQYKEAGKVLKRYGSDVRCAKIRRDIASAKQHRKWIYRIRRALDAAETGRRRKRPFWQRTRPGVWGHEVMTYKAQQAAAMTTTNPKRHRRLPTGQADTPGPAA